MENLTSELRAVKTENVDMCRLCMKNSEHYFNIFPSTADCSITIGKAIEDLLNLEVAEGDGLPGAVCSQCVQKLMEFQEFKEMCMKSAIELRRCTLYDNNTCPVKDADMPAPLLVEGDRSNWNNLAEDESHVSEMENATADPLALETDVMGVGHGESQCKESVEFEHTDDGAYAEGPAVYIESTSLEMRDETDATESNHKSESRVETYDCREYEQADKTYPEGTAVYIESLEIKDESLLREQEVSMAQVDGRREENLDDRHYSIDTTSNAEIDPLHTGNVCHVRERSIPSGSIAKEDGSRQDNLSVNTLPNVEIDPLHTGNMMVVKGSDSSMIKLEVKNEEEVMIGDDDEERFESSEGIQLQLENQVRDRLKAEEISKGNESMMGDSSLDWQQIPRSNFQSNSTLSPSGPGLSQRDDYILPSANPDHEPERTSGTYEMNSFESQYYPKTASQYENERCHDNEFVIKQEQTEDSTEYLCNRCGIRFVDKNTLSEHIRGHVDHSISLSCANIPEGSSVESSEFTSTRFDEQLKHGLSGFGEGLKEKRKRRKRTNVNTDGEAKVFKCEICGKEYKHRSVLTQHLYVHSTEKQFKCKVCGREFKHKHSVAQHAATHRAEVLKCEVCGKEFLRRNSLANHMSIHTGTNRFECGTCGKRFVSMGNLKMHMGVHTTVRPFRCQICGREFRLKSNFVSHVGLHTSLRPFKCDTCGKEFKTKDNLLSHLKIHSGLREFQCGTCGKAFYRKDHLAKHSSVHNVVKPYGCCLCGKRFAQANSLTKHIDMHGKQKQFTCDLCGKAYKAKGNLVIHMRMHVGVNRLKCETCGKQLRRTRDLLNHLKTHYPPSPLK